MRKRETGLVQQRSIKGLLIPPGPRGAQCAHVTGHLPCSNPAGGWVNVVANIHSEKKKKNIYYVVYLILYITPLKFLK